MARRSITLLEETVFQHVTIHKLMIYIYGKMKMSQDPLLAVIRTNMLELKNMARGDPSVLIASTKTILKTLLNFTRLTCISPEALNFIRRLMQDVHVRMRKLWDIYKIHGAYEILKKSTGKENLLKKDTKKKCSKLKLSSTSTKKEDIVGECMDSFGRSLEKNQLDIATDIGDSVVNELAKNGCLDKMLLDKLNTLTDENNQSEKDSSIGTDSVSSSVRQGSKSPKKRKIRKWSQGIFQAKKKKRLENSFKVPVKVEQKECVSEHLIEKLPSDQVVSTPKQKPVEENVSQPVPVKELVKKVELDDDDDNGNESSSDKCTNIVDDPTWNERSEAQSQYYLNEMSKVTSKLNSMNYTIPKYNFIDQLASKLEMSVTTYGLPLRELLVMDHADLLRPIDAPVPPSAPPPKFIERKNEVPSCSATVGLFKASRQKRHFIYECLDKNCSVKTTELQFLHNHAISVHKDLFSWDWTCSSCGVVVEGNLLKTAKSLDMALYHLQSHHSKFALKSNSSDFKFRILDKNVVTKNKHSSPGNQNSSMNAVEENRLSSYRADLFKCLGCNFSTSLLSDGVKHFLGHGVLTCIYCLFKESTALGLCEHLEEYHSSSKFLCSECHFRSVSECNTVNHYVDEHVNVRELRDIVMYINMEPYSLKCVPPRFYPPSQLSTYICKHGDGDEDFVTLLGSNFVTHIFTCQSAVYKRGNAGKKYQCSICDAKVSAPYKLRQHFESHQVHRYICIYCGRGHTKLDVMNAHLYTIHMYWPPRYIIRENYDKWTIDKNVSYSYSIRYETDFEPLVEVSAEIYSNVDKDKIKLKTLSGKSLKWEDLISKSDSKVEVRSTSDPGHCKASKPPGIIELSDEECDLDSVNQESADGICNEVIEIPSDADDEIEVSCGNQQNLSTNSDITTKSPTDCRISLVKSDTVAETRMNLEMPSVSNSSSLLTNEVQTDGSKQNLSTIKTSLALVHVLNPSVPETITSQSPCSSSSSSSLTGPQENSFEAGLSEFRTPKIKVIAEAKMDNFRKSFSSVSDLVKIPNFTDDFNASIANPSSSHASRIRVTSKKINLKTIHIRRDPNQLTSSEDSSSFKCQYCEYEGLNSSGLTLHMNKIHIDVGCDSSSEPVETRFKCAICRCPFDAFASLHKHMETQHSSDTYGVFKIFARGYLVVRKDIKICFLCSALIVSLEQLYKHPDICPFAHTTGTSLNSSIVYATGKNLKICMQTCFVYKKSEIKVKKSIVELLQPHLPTPANDDGVAAPTAVAVAKKSTGPRQLYMKSPMKRAVARKSTGPHLLPSTYHSPSSSKLS